MTGNEIPVLIVLPIFLEKRKLESSFKHEHAFVTVHAVESHVHRRKITSTGL